jgi:DNA/RNA endonuclease G (NUC1)
VFYEIGIMVPGANTFVKFFTICFNEQTKSVFFSQEKISKASLVSVQKSHSSFSSWNDFGHGNLAAQINDAYSTVYNKKGKVSGQMKRFVDLFKGDVKKAEKYINKDANKSKLFFARGHLSANANQPFETWRKATYAYINHVPQWQKINQGSWIAVENHVRKLSKGMDIFVTTGGHGELEIENIKVSMVANNLVQIPKYMWKIVEIKGKPNNGMGFVIRNFPFKNSIPDLCNDRAQYCAKNFKKYTNVNGGFLTCCSVAALKKAIGYDPKIHFNSPRKTFVEILMEIRM